MSTTLFFRSYCLSVLIGLTSASVVREFPILNSTTPAIEANSSAYASPLPRTRTTTKTAQWIPHETTVTGFVSQSTTQRAVLWSTTSAPGDIGSIIISPIGPGIGNTLSSVHIESTASRLSGEIHPPHLEITVLGLDGDDSSTPSDPRITPPPVVPPALVIGKERILRPTVVTSIVISSETLTAGGKTVTIGDEPGATRIYLDYGGHPVAVVESSTLTYQIPHAAATIDGQVLMPDGSPITVGSGFGMSTISINEAGETIAVIEGVTSTLQAPPIQAFTIDGITATAVATNYQYALGSSILYIGQPVTIDGTILSLTTDISGSTLLIAGDSTTTLPPLAPVLTTPAPNNEPASIMTTVLSGTTQYIVDSQSLYPGHPITVNGTAISMTTISGATVLIIGNMTTTLDGQTTTTLKAGVSRITTGIAAATPGVTGAGSTIPSATGTKSDAMPGMTKWSSMAVFVCGILAVGLAFG